jgi:carbon starvation protein CstA
MRIRPNIFLASSVLLTLGVLWLLPSTINCIRATNTMYRLAGLASLTIIIVALIIIWTGLAAGNRLAWVIMAVIVWVWALPFMTLPVLLHGRRWTLSELREWMVIAWREDTFARTNLIYTAMFLLMLVGLILPVRALFRSRKPKPE